MIAITLIAVALGCICSTVSTAPDTDCATLVETTKQPAMKYEGHYYQIYEDKDIHFNDAQAKCEKNGGYLFEPDTKAEWDHFFTTLIHQRKLFRNQYWIGVTVPPVPGVPMEDRHAKQSVAILAKSRKEIKGPKDNWVYPTFYPDGRYGSDSVSKDLGKCLLDYSQQLYPDRCAYALEFCVCQYDKPPTKPLQKPKKQWKSGSKQYAMWQKVDDEQFFTRDECKQTCAEAGGTLPHPSSQQEVNDAITNTGVKAFRSRIHFSDGILNGDGKWIWESTGEEIPSISNTAITSFPPYSREWTNEDNIVTWNGIWGFSDPLGDGYVCEYESCPAAF